MSWILHAVPLRNRPGSFMHVGMNPDRCSMYGATPDQVVCVQVTEDLNGTHWGWLNVGVPEGPPRMVQPHRSMFDMQFPYGPESEEARRKGRIVQLAVVEVDA